MRELVIDTGRARTAGELHGLLADALGFPDYYGRNLAALGDCLGDIAQPTRITLVRRPAAQPAGTDLPGPSGLPDAPGLPDTACPTGPTGPAFGPLDRPLTDRYLDLLAGVLLRSARDNPALDVRVVDSGPCVDVDDGPEPAEPTAEPTDQADSSDTEHACPLDGFTGQP